MGRFINMQEDVIYSRRSIRKYAKEEISKETLESIIDAGRVAPSAKNRQPWQCLVFGGEEKAKVLSEMEKGIEREENSPLLPRSGKGIADAKNTLRIMKEAPIVMMILNTNGTSPFLERDVDDRITECCDLLSIGAFIENMLLKAEEIGIGTLWIANTCFAYPELVSYLETDYELVGAIALGYAAEKPNPRPRKKLEDFTKFRL